MGREVRRVPANWEHPKYSEDSDMVMRGWRTTDEYQPMYDTNYSEICAEWKEDFKKWEDGEKLKHPREDGGYYEYWEWYGSVPDRDYYLPEIAEEDQTWYQLYETVSEGCPVSPPFETKQELVEYLVEHGDFWYQQDQEKRRPYGRTKDTREHIEKLVKGGYAPTLVVEVKGGE